MCLFAHIFIYFSSSRAVSGRQMSCSQEKKKKKSFAVKIREGRWRENIWICKSCHSVEPCNEWEMLSPSFIMQRSLLNARQLGLASSLRAPPPLPNLSCHLTATRTKLQPGTKQHRVHGYTPAYAVAERKPCNFRFISVTSCEGPMQILETRKLLRHTS